MSERECWKVFPKNIYEKKWGAPHDDDGVGGYITVSIVL